MDICIEVIRLAHLHLIVTGDVQGVGYRYFAQMKATQFGITGWVKNREDGSVEMEVVGEQASVDQFIRVLQEGNPFSKVSSIEVETLDATPNFHSFKIKY